MSLTDADIDRFIEHAPNATLVAIYSGECEEGELGIVVRYGRRAALGDVRRCGGGIIIDLPALQWLSRQPEPRVWISDGGVTGCWDIQTRAITSRCKEVCEAAGIVRVDNVERAAALLAQTARK